MLNKENIMLNGEFFIFKLVKSLLIQTLRGFQTLIELTSLK